MSSPEITTGGNSLPETNVISDPKRLTLHNLLVVYPIIIAIVKNLNFRQLISLAQTDKDCFAFLRGGGWDSDVRRWNNIRSNCLEVCEFSDSHDYFDPIKEIKACKDCKYGVCNQLRAAPKYCIGPVKYLGERGRTLCSTCANKRLAGHPKYQGMAEFPDCQCIDDQDPWLCRYCWKLKYFACQHGLADICVDCGAKVDDVNTKAAVCSWCQGKIL